MDKIIIDTSAWIDAFRPKAKKGLGLLVKDLILQDRVLMPGIIKAELLRGTRTKSEFDRLSDLLKGITYLSVPDEFWERLAEFSFQLFRKGITVPLADTYIALLCLENKVPILHRDKHFDLISEKTALMIHKG
jgi:predicted nucleic acid-binding protein